MLRRLLPAALTLGCLALAAPARAGGPENAYYANDTDGIFWFMHISDLHVGCATSLEPGVKYDPENLVFALNDAVDVIAPVFVVATGDLVNGSRNNIPTSGQSQSEWDEYKGIYTAALAAHAVPYYDIVGNHDEYAVTWPNDECPSLHWYLDNSYRGQLEGAAHFSWTYTTPLGDYFFYGFNSTGDCVPAFTGGDGTILDGEYDALKTALEGADGAELRFVFAHQGPSQPQNSARVVDELVKHGVFYVHGHIHEYKEYLLGNDTGDIVVNECDSTGKAAENNLAVGVVDHNAFIYRATSLLDPWPQVIITAPVATRLRDQALNPYAYDVCKDRVNPVRALVFADQPPASVTVQVGTGQPVAMTQASAWLWTAQVDTSALAEGQQTVTVTAVAGGKTRSDVIGVELVAGPCQVQDDGGVPQQDAGSQSDAGGATDGGLPGQDAAVGSDAGSGEPGSGCDCRAAGAGRRGPGAAGLAGLAVLALGLALQRGARRRRQGRGRARSARF
jgi:hypothetical protein